VEELFWKHYTYIRWSIYKRSYYYKNNAVWAAL